MSLHDYAPASLWNTPGKPPIFGQIPVPLIFTMAGRFTDSSIHLGLLSLVQINTDKLVA